VKPLNGKQMIDLLKKHGWEIDRIQGSHYILMKEGSDAAISVPVHGKRELKPGVQYGILKDAGLAAKK